MLFQTIFIHHKFFRRLRSSKFVELNKFLNKNTSILVSKMEIAVTAETMIQNLFQ